MTCRSILTGAVFLAGLTLGNVTHAATIVDIHGEVLVSMGTGFQPVGPPFVLWPGNQVFVRPGGAASILFDDGCKVPIEPGAVVQVGEISPCRAKAAEGGSAGVNGSTLLVGGLVIGGGAALAIGLSGGGKDKPASP